MGTIFKINSAVLTTPKATALALGRVPAASLPAFLPELNILGEALEASGVSNADQFIRALSELEKATSHPKSLKNIQRKMLAVVKGIDNPELWNRVQVEALERNTRRFAPSGSIAAVFHQKSAAPGVKLLSVKDALTLADMIARELMEYPELADAESIRHLEEAVYQAQKMDKKITDYVLGLEKIVRHHPSKNIRTLADSSLERIYDSLQTNSDALASLELDMDQLWKALEGAVVARERDLIKIREWVLLIMKVGFKKGEKEFEAQMDKLLLHPVPLVRLEALSLYIPSFGANDMIPDFWAQQKPLIETDMTSSDRRTIFTACVELEQFAQWGVEEAIEMFSDLSNSQNPIIQHYLGVIRK